MTAALKKTMSILLVVMLLMSAVPFALATDITATVGNLTYRLEDNGTLTLSGTGGMQNWAADEAPWYSRRTSIKKVVFDGDLTTIGANAFRGCVNLANITFSGKETSIGSHAFDGCTGLLGLTLPAALKTIGMEAFIGSGVSTITLPASVNNIEDFAFSNCANFKNFYVAEGNKTYATDGSGCLLNTAKTKLLLAPNGKTSCTVSNTVKEIAPYSFYGCSKLESVDIPDGVTTIGRWAFWKCTALKSLALPNSVVRIDNGAFCECTTLKSAAIPAKVYSVGDHAFYGCTSLESLIVESKDCELNEMLENKTQSTADEYISRVGTYAKSNVTIYGEKGSTAEEYAKTYDYTFRTIGEEAEQNPLLSKLPGFLADMVEMFKALFAKLTELFARFSASAPQDPANPGTPATPADSTGTGADATSQFSTIFQGVISIVQQMFQSISAKQE